jgi:hypothetical protein
MGTVSAPFTVGALLRRSFRRELIASGLTFTEDKGLLDSLFVVKATPDVIEVIQSAVDDYNEERRK